MEEGSGAEMKTEKRKRGRPTVYSHAVAERICARLAQGEPLAVICEDDDMPPAPTVRGWVVDDRCGFAALSARAYALGHDAIAEQCLKIADTTMEGVETTTKADGSVEERRGDMLQHRRLQIETRLRLLGKWAPKKYGERQELHHTADESLATAIIAARKRVSG